MWVLSKYPVSDDGTDQMMFYMLPGRQYIIGRKDCDIVLPGDPSISRKHAIVNITPFIKDGPNKVTVTDTSKVGVHVNKSKIESKKEIEISSSDIISFGKVFKLKLEQISFNAVVSCLKSDSKSKVKSLLGKLGGRCLSEWNNNVTHLIMQQVTFTIKVVCALASGTPIVLVKYFEDLLDCCDKKNVNKLPLETDYLPPIEEPTLQGKECLLQINEERKSLLIGKEFVSLHAKQYKRVKHAIELAGGSITLNDQKNSKMFKKISTNQILILFIESKEEKQVNEEQKNWISSVYEKVKKSNLRSIRESEIGLAILNNSIQEFCNPTTKTAPSLTNTSHSQVLQDTLVAETQSFSQSQRSQFKVPETIDITMSETAGQNEEGNYIKKRKRRLESPNRQGKSKLIKTEEIKIEDAEEALLTSLIEEDVFDAVPSIEIPKTKKPAKLAQSKVDNSDKEPSEFLSNTSTVYDKPQNSLFVNDTILTSNIQTKLNPSTNVSNKKVVQDTCPIFDNDNNNDNDNPFDFDVPEFSTSSSSISKVVQKVVSDSQGELPNSLYIDEINNINNGLKSEDKSNDSFDDMIENNVKLGENKENSPSQRFIKASHDTQDFCLEEIVLSDGEELISNCDKSDDEINSNQVNNQSNDRCLSLDNGDLMVSEEFLPNAKTKVKISSDGFISVKNKKSTMPAKLDPDLDDIPDDLIQTECVTLIKKNQQLTKQQRNNLNKKNVKNFKCFRKQLYAGRSSKRIHRNDLVVYESSNQQRDALFDEFIEEMEEEEEEERNADQLFNWQSMDD